jgi:hypothetical protein
MPEACVDELLAIVERDGPTGKCYDRKLIGSRTSRHRRPSRSLTRTPRVARPSTDGCGGSPLGCRLRARLVGTSDAV